MLKLGFASLMVAVLAACGVYALKHQVQRLQLDLRRVERTIERERTEIKRLQAEWATLSQPGRLAHLAETYLKLQPATPRQIASIADIPMRREPDDDGQPALVSSQTPAISAKPRMHLAESASGR